MGLENFSKGETIEERKLRKWTFLKKGKLWKRGNLRGGHFFKRGNFRREETWVGDIF